MKEKIYKFFKVHKCQRCGKTFFSKEGFILCERCSWEVFEEHEFDDEREE